MASDALLPPAHGNVLWTAARWLLSAAMIVGAGYWVLSGTEQILIQSPCTNVPVMLRPLSLAVVVTLLVGAVLILLAHARPRLAMIALALPIAGLIGWAVTDRIDAARQAQCQSQSLDEAIASCNADLRHFVRARGNGTITLNLRSDAGFDGYACLERWERFQRGVAVGLDPEFFQRR